MCAWQVFKYRMLLLRAADCGKNSSTLHQSVAPDNEPAHKWTAFCIEIFASLSYPRSLYSS
jgi:hypothetical protein